MRKVWQAGWLGLALALCPGPGEAGAAQEAAPASLNQMSSQDLMALVVSHENEASKHRGYYTYLSIEKSERTGGHQWTERVAETLWGKVRYLVAEDGTPLGGDRLKAEQARIADEGARPEIFKQQEEAKAEDEQHARQMLTLLPKAFLFDPPQQDPDGIRVKYHPNPAYTPNGLEERVLHAMTGSVLVDSRMARVRSLEGRMPQDVSIGFGLLATIKAGSNFSTTRIHEDGYDWKTETVHTDINGKALFLKTIARAQEARHSDFKKIPAGMTVADAVKLLEQ